MYQIKTYFVICWLFIRIDQGFPTFLRSRTTWVPRIVNAYHFFLNNQFDRVSVSSEEYYTLKYQ